MTFFDAHPYYDLVLPDNLEKFHVARSRAVGHLGKFHVACTVLPDTRVATPQLSEELCTLPVEVSFTHRLMTHVLNM